MNSFSKSSYYSDSATHLSSRKFFIGFSGSFFPIMKYSFPNYANLNPRDTTCTKCGDEEKRNYISYVFVVDFNIQIKYQLNKHFSGGIGLSHIYEEIPVGNYNYKYNDNNTLTYTSIGRLQNRYLGIPIMISALVPCKRKENVFFTIDAGANFDIIYSEKQTNGSEALYAVTAAIPYPTISRQNFPVNPRNNKFNFNRIVPFAHLYVEWYSKKNEAVSCNLGTTIFFKSVYQLDNTAEYYKSYKVSPIVFGINYHFK